jgi:hypothetical protein
MGFGHFLPDSGQGCCDRGIISPMLTAVTGGQRPFEDLIAHLTRSSSLSSGEAARLIAEVVGYFSESAEAYVRRRHGELKARGLTNDRAFDQIAAELPQRLVAPPQFSVRQLRRIIYG